jgi:hypothetical protein
MTLQHYGMFINSPLIELSKGRSYIDNRETQATLETRHRIKTYKTTTTKNTIRKTNNKATRPSPEKNKPGVDPGASEW